MCELQLHLQDIHDMKHATHRVYKLLRAAGWDDEQEREYLLKQREEGVEYSATLEPHALLEIESATNGTVLGDLAAMAAGGLAALTQSGGESFKGTTPEPAGPGQSGRGRLGYLGSGRTKGAAAVFPAASGEVPHEDPEELELVAVKPKAKAAGRAFLHAPSDVTGHIADSRIGNAGNAVDSSREGVYYDE